MVIALTSPSVGVTDGSIQRSHSFCTLVRMGKMGEMLDAVLLITSFQNNASVP